MRAGCLRVRQRLHAFLDRELRGSDVLMVSSHLDVCRECGDEARTLTELGEMLRGAAASTSVPMDDLAGLADGVVSRVRAEDQQSWFATLSRGVDDCHWLLVGVGSVAAAVISTLLVCAMIQVGVQEREDSLAGVMMGLSSSVDVVTASLAVPPGGVAMATVNRYGRVTDLQMVSPLTRRDERALEGALRDLRQEDSGWRPDVPQATRVVWLVSTTVYRVPTRGVLE